jgi:regulatory protein
VLSADGPPAGEGEPADEAQRALELAYRYLAPRDRTEAQVAAHLAARGTRPAVASGCLRELREQGYLDDARFAHRFAEDRRRLDGWGRERILRRLREHGVADDLASSALGALGEEAPEDALGGDPELRAAVAVLCARMRVPPTDDRGRARALGLLARRGYELELAHDAIRRFQAGAA